MKIRVLVVDDHDIARQGIKAVLEGEETIEVVGEATDGAQAVEKSLKLNPDVILMDVKMPGTNGVQAARAILGRQPHIRILALSAFDGDEEVFGSIEAGISGYVLKDIRPSQLSKAILTVYEGKSQLDPGIAHKVINNIAVKSQQPSSEDVALTKRENEVLQLLAEGLKNRAIAEQLWISEKTVKVYVAKLFKKLGSSSRTEVVLKAAEMQLVEIKN